MKATFLRQPARSLVARLVASALVPALTLASVPASAAPPAQPAAATAVKVNRTVPKVRPIRLRPVFSAEPTDMEIFRARVFEEPLVPVNGNTTPDENRALAEAIQAFVEGGDRLDLRPFERFLRNHDSSPWRASLRLGMGMAYLSAGRFTRAAAAWEEAWGQTRDLEDAPARAVANRALGELAELRASFTQATELERLLEEAEGRSMSGSAVEKLNSARARFAARTEHPHLIRPTGALALARILANRSKDANYRIDPRLQDFRAPQYGSTLTQIEALAKEVGLDFQMAYHADKSVPIEVPSVVHLNMGHYAAVVARNEAGTRYLLSDPAFGPMWVTREALLEEASGYFLIDGKELPTGWHAVEKADGDRILGRCLGPGNSDDTTRDTPCRGGQDCCPKGMATYTFLALTINLRITDTPVGYTPPRGPAVHFQVTYNHKEATQPQTFTYSNLGSRWTFDHLSFIEDESPADIELHVRGGGLEHYLYGDGQVYGPHYRSQNRVVRVSSNPIVWEVRRPDGSVDTYAQPDCDVCSGRRVFMTESKDPAGNALSYSYDEMMRLVAITDALGQVTTISYDLASDPLKVTRVADPFGRYAQFDYDAVGRLTRITDVIGLTSEFTYASTEQDLTDFITALTTPYGTTTFSQTLQTGGKFSALEATDPLGGKERIAYNKDAQNIPEEQKPASQDAAAPTGFGPENVGLDEALTHYWDKRAMALYPGDFRKAEVIRWLIEPSEEVGLLRSSDVIHSIKKPLESRVWYGYPGVVFAGMGGNLSRGPTARPAKIARLLDDGTSQIYRYEYNAQGAKIRETDPLGRTKTFTYAANGIDLLEVRRVRGQETELLRSYTYNDKHQPLTVTDARNATTTYTYNAAGEVLTVTTPPAQGQAQGATTTYTYDNDGRLLQVSGPVPSANRTFTYDDYGRRHTATDQAGLTRTYDYDALDRVTKISYPDGTYEETTYNRLDAEGQRDRLGRWTHTFYDALRRAVATRDAAGGMTQLVYAGPGCSSCGGGADQLAALVDANGNETRWDYDLQGRVTQETRADASSESYTYETTTSRIKQKTDRKGVTTTVEYFLDDKLKRKSYSDSTPAVSYTHDPVTGEQVTAANGTDTLTWTYDSLDRVATEVSAKNASAVGYSYDDARNRIALTLDGATYLSYGYDQYSRLTSINRGAQSFGIGYDTASRRTSLTYPSGVATSYGYDTESRLTSVGASLGNTPITSFVYGLDGTGNRTSKATLDWTETYGYDAANRLVSADRSAGTPSRWRFAYDAAGNRTAAQTDDAVLGASFNNVNELLSTQAGGALLFKGTTNEPASVTVAGTAAQTTAPPQDAFSAQTPIPSGTSNVVVAATDASGNTRTNTYQVSASAAGASYTYDANGSLATKSEGGDSWMYEWNAENQLTRVTKNSSEVVRFSYDPLGRRVEKVAGGVTTSYTYDGASILREVRGATTLKYVGYGIDEPLAVDDGTTLSYFHADGLGSIVRVTDASGAATFTRQYNAWGAPEAGAGSSGYAFTGREWDPEPALYYYRARYYDAQLGRFLSEDPIGCAGGLNWYAYVDNLPTGLIDPTGHRGFTWSGQCAAQKKKPSLLDRFLAWKPFAPPAGTADEDYMRKSSPCSGGDAKTLFNAHFPCNLGYDRPIGGGPGPNVTKLDEWMAEFRSKCKGAKGSYNFVEKQVLGSPDPQWYGFCCCNK